VISLPTVREIFEGLKGRLAANPAKIATLKGTYQFELTGDDGGIFHAAFDSGQYDIGEGAAQSPGCTITMSTADFVALVSGQLNPAAAFMTSKLKMKGDMGLAMKLQSLLS
jgi:putative sterol carrier protein